MKLLKKRLLKIEALAKEKELVEFLWTFKELESPSWKQWQLYLQKLGKNCKLEDLVEASRAIPDEHDKTGGTNE